MAETASWQGAIVAIEGPKTVVSTQLRLLPSSSEILILPALETYIPTPASFLDIFDPVHYLRQINTAMKRRHRDAQTFLQRSSAEEGSCRLVFLEGGVASAHALCLKALMDHETAGDRGAAEAVLARLTRHGLAGLADAGQEHHHSEPIYYSGHGDEEESSDPSTRAMRAADALDRQTASLQVSNELDLTIRRSSSLPLYGYAGTPSGDAAPFLVFGQSSLDDCPPTTERLAKSPFRETPRFSVVQYDRQGDMPSVTGFDDFPAAKSLSTSDGANPLQRDSSAAAAAAHRRMASETISPLSDAFSLRSSLGNVEYGRASLLDMRTSVRGNGFMDVKAVGRSTATDEPKHNELSTAETTPPEYNNTPARQFNVNLTSTQKNSLSTAGTMPSTFVRVPSSTNRPRTVVVKRTRPVIKLQPVPSSKKRRWQQSKSTYIDDDGDAPASKPHASSDSDEYEPIFPRMEDLVLYLRSDLTPQPLLESALNAMREEYMRKSSCLSPSSSASTVSTASFKPLSQPDDEGTAGLTTPETSGAEQDSEDQETPKTAVEVATEALPSMDDYDPFAYINPVYRTAQTSKVTEPTVTILRPPTPAQTPPPNDVVELDSQEAVLPEARPKQLEADTEKEVVEELDSTIHEITIEPKQPPIGVQNVIRSVLRQRYPVATAAPASGGYTPQLQLPQRMPNSSSRDDDEDSLWRPIFRSRKTSSLPAGSGRQLKQILAIGLQNGVMREYAARVIGQIEKFGTEPTGSARCSRLDFRYLLANTMQAFTSRPLTSQTAENPFTSPHLLATLMLPHLETYLSVHADIRFLILEYPPEHLATVIAIQKLAGVEHVKIAQLVNAHSKPERLPFRHVREGSVGSSSVASAEASHAGSGGSATSVYSKRSSSLSGMSMYGDLIKAKANFLLTSEASDKDIADFVAAVWNLPVAQRPQSAPEGIAAATTSLPPARQSPSLPPVLSAAELSAAELPQQQQQQKTPVKRKAKPAPLRGSAVSAFPKTTGPQSPLSPSANIMSVLAPPPPLATAPPSMTPPALSKPTTLRTITAEDFYTMSPSPVPRTPSPDAAGGQHGAMRVSAVGGGSGSSSNLTTTTATTTLQRQPSNCTMRTTNSRLSTTSRATTMHIAYMQRMPPTPLSSRAFSPPSASPSLLPPVPRFLDTPSIAGSTLLYSPLGFDSDAASMMTFDPAEDSDYDQEEARLMPMFGKKQRRTRPGTQKALKVLGMMA